MSTRSQRSVVETIVKVFPIIGALTYAIWTVFVYLHPSTGAAVAVSLQVPSAASQTTPVQSETQSEPAPAATQPLNLPQATVLVTDAPTMQTSAPAVEGAATALAAVQSFYGYLHDGRGQEASLLVVPEKRLSGPFAPFQLSHFYGNLEKPIELLETTPIGESSYQVHYRYTATKSACDGKALIGTSSIKGRYFVSGIRAFNGC